MSEWIIVIMTIITGMSAQYGGLAENTSSTLTRVYTTRGTARMDQVCLNLSQEWQIGPLRTDPSYFIDQ